MKQNKLHFSQIRIKSRSNLKFNKLQCHVQQYLTKFNNGSKERNHSVHFVTIVTSVPPFPFCFVLAENSE